MIEGLPVLQLGAGGLVTLIVLMILTDRLVTKGRLNELRADRDQILAALRISEAARETSAAQVGTLVQQGAVIEQFMRSIQPPHLDHQ